MRAYKIYNYKGFNQVYSFNKLNDEICDEVELLLPASLKEVTINNGMQTAVETVEGEIITSFALGDKPILQSKVNGKTYKCSLTHGCKRPNAGAKKTLPEGAKRRAINATDKEWQQVKELIKIMRSRNNEKIN